MTCYHDTPLFDVKICGEKALQLPSIKKMVFIECNYDQLFDQMHTWTPCFVNIKISSMNKCMNCVVCLLVSAVQICQFLP